MIQRTVQLHFGIAVFLCALAQDALPTLDSDVGRGIGYVRVSGLWRRT